MELRLLGPVELWSAGARVELGAPKQRCVLAVLALSAGAAVSPESLIDRVWGERQPRDVRNVLYSHIARLRRLFSATTGKKPTAVLHKDSTGYLLDIDRDTVDAYRFRATIEIARRAASDAERSALLHDALTLWRGTPLSGITGQWADSVRAGLEQLRLNALGDRIDLDLRSGPPSSALIEELTAVLSEDPLAERFAEQLMLTLYRSGRSAEALTVFERIRKHLEHELGSDPGPDLQRLHQQILTRDSALQPGDSLVSRPEAARQLPVAPTTFVGRETEFQAARNSLIAENRPAAAIVAVYGAGGVGKSALASRVAHAVSEHYPDGQLYVDLHGASPGLSPLSPLDALGRFLRALGVPGSGVPDETEEAAAKLRSLLAKRRVLLVLDNAAATAQVRPLLPANAACGALVTSRSFLSTLGDVHHIGLTVLRPDESVALLGELDPTGRLAADPERAGELAALCDHLPLALRVTAARVTSRPDWPLVTFVERLADHQYRLDRLGHDDTSVRACFEVSYRALQQAGPSEQTSARAFRLLGLPDGPDISLSIAARLLDMPDPQAELALDRLVDAQLLDSPVPGRYRMHDLVRLYARELAQRETTESDRYAALGRTWRCYVSTAAHAAQLLRPGRRAGLVTIDPAETLPLADHKTAQQWLEDDLANLIGAAHQAAAAPGDLALNTVHLAHALFGYMHSNHHWSALRDMNLLALEVTRRRGAPPSEGQVLNDLGVMAWRAGDGDEAVRLFSQSRDVRRAAGDVIGEAFSLFNLATARQERGEYSVAAHLLEEALNISRDVGYRSGEAMALQVLADVNRQLENLELSMAQIRCALDIYRALGDSLGQAHGLRTQGASYSELGRLGEAAACFEQALQICREWSSTVEAASNLALLADIYRLSGELPRALAAGQEALALSRQAGAPKEQAMALCSIGRVLAETGEVDRAREHWREALPILDRLGSQSVSEVRKLLKC